MVLNVEAAKAAVVGVSDNDPELAQAAHVAEQERIELDGRKQFYGLRIIWSWCIVAWITLFIVFHATLAFGVGLKWLDFNDHKWLAPLIIVENFLQIVGMGYIVVRFLYPGSVPSQPGKIPAKATNSRASNKRPLEAPPTAPAPKVDNSEAS